MLVQKGEALVLRAIDFSMQSNIAVVDAMSSSFKDLNTTLLTLQESLSKDAGHIGQMGKEFSEVDSALSKHIDELL